MKRYLLFIACVIISSAVYAQTSENKSDGPSVYAGIQGGMPMGVSSFSSLNADFPGWDAGVFAGYRFNDMMSVELDASFGNLNMLPRNFCKQYFFDEEAGISYMRLKNKTFIHRYSARFNLNLLSFFAATENTPWKAEVSPALSLLGRSGRFVRLADETDVLGTVKGFNFGVGCRIGASYTFDGKYQVGLYAGYTQFTGAAIDGLPKNKGSFIAEAGARFAYNISLGKGGRSRVSGPSKVEVEVELPAQPVAEDTIATAEPEVVVLTVDQRREQALEGLNKYPDAVMANAVSFVDSLMASATTYEDFFQKMKWLEVEVLPESRGYGYMGETVAAAEKTLYVLSKVSAAEAMLAQAMQKDAVRALSAELSALETDRQFVADRIASLKTLLDRYYLTTTWALDIIERLEAARQAPDLSQKAAEIFAEYNDNGRMAIIREIPFMNGIIDQLTSCFPEADWTKVAEIKTLIENSRK